jgi:hypothetical protein
LGVLPRRLFLLPQPKGCFPKDAKCSNLADSLTHDWADELAAQPHVLEQGLKPQWIRLELHRKIVEERNEMGGKG